MFPFHEGTVMKAAPVQGRAGELLLPDLIKGSNMMVIN
jgi:hypothetical protein